MIIKFWIDADISQIWEEEIDLGEYIDLNEDEDLEENLSDDKIQEIVDEIFYDKIHWGWEKVEE